MSRPRMPGTKRVAIIGGGLAGLAAARLLCLRGMAVELHEANDKLGGCCATTPIAGYAFNDGALFVSLPGLLDQLFHRLGLDRASLLPLRRIVQVQTATLPDGTAVHFGDGPPISVDGGRGAAAADEACEELRQFLDRWDPLLRVLAEDLLVHPPSLSRFIAGTWRHLRLLRGTAASRLKDSFSDEAVRAAMSGALLYAGIPPDRAPASSLVALAALFRDGYFLPEGGMGRIPETLGRAVRELGGEIHLGSRVKRILVRNGRAHGIEVASRGVVEADAVVSTTSGMHTFASLLSESDVPPAMGRKVRGARLSHKGYVLQLGLSNRIDARSYSNYVLPWLDGQQALFEPDPRRLRWPIYTVPTNAMPELAPPGASIVEMFPPIRQDLAPQDWGDELREEVAAQAIERLGSLHAVDIVVRRVRSPREFQEASHLFAGALYGLAPLGNPMAMFPHRSPIRGLYQAGQTTWPGFGVASAGISGVLAAEALAGDAGLEA